MLNLEAFSQFASDLDKATLAQLARGQRLRELDDLEVTVVPAFLKGLIEYINVKDTTFIKMVKESKKLAPEAEELLKTAIDKVKQEMSK